jgi:hypothetical protein
LQALSSVFGEISPSIRDGEKHRDREPLSSLPLRKEGIEASGRMSRSFSSDNVQNLNTGPELDSFWHRYDRPPLQKESNSGPFFRKNESSTLAIKLDRKGDNRQLQRRDEILELRPEQRRDEARRDETIVFMSDAERRLQEVCIPVVYIQSCGTFSFLSVSSVKKIDGNSGD